LRLVEAVQAWLTAAGGPRPSVRSAQTKWAGEGVAVSYFCRCAVSPAVAAWPKRT
jgi:hypothetical protein